MAKRKSSKTSQSAPETVIATDAAPPSEATTSPADLTEGVATVEATAAPAMADDALPLLAVPSEPEPAIEASAPPLALDADAATEPAAPGLTDTPTVATDETPAVAAETAPAEPVAAAPEVTQPEAADAPSVVAIDTAQTRRRPFLGAPFARRAAAIAVAAALGAAGGSLLTGGIRSGDSSTPEPLSALRVSVSQLAAEISALKAASGGGAADATIAKLERRLDEAETMQGALLEKLTRVSEMLDRTASVSPEITGTVRSAAAAPIAEPTSPSAVEGWVLWRVANGRALVQGNGGYYEVMTGSSLPGLGVVKKITRSDGRWIVVTPKGAILPPQG